MNYSNQEYHELLNFIYIYIYLNINSKNYFKASRAEKEDARANKPEP